MIATPAQTQNRQFAGYADLPGVRLLYTDSGGSGVPVVLLHANTGNADSCSTTFRASSKRPIGSSPSAAHSINWERPEGFNRNVLEFIKDWRDPLDRRTAR